jgi:OmpA-OmpF porin, OOP family
VRGTSFLLFLLAGYILCAQTDSAVVRDASGKTLRKMGRNALRQNDPNSAVTFLEAYTSKRPGSEHAEALLLLGKAYMGVRDYEKAELAFAKAYAKDDRKAIEALYYYAQMQKSNGKYDSAKIAFQKFRKTYKGEDRGMKKQATREIAFCDSISKVLAIENRIYVTRLDNSINKVNTEGAPALLDGNTLLFTSLRTDKREYETEADTSMVRRVYVAKKINGVWKFSGELGAVNEDGVNTGNAALSQDGKRMYFSRCKRNMKEQMVCNIYMSEFVKGEWTEPEKLPAPVNAGKYSSSMPAVATDPLKGTDVLYFVSNRRKGKGGTDIWFSAYDRKSRKFKAPRNAGVKINTARDEITPYFDNANRTLYFSSDGHGGLGGFDIYRATGDGKRWILVQNVGRPYNSGADDIYFTVVDTGNAGFFVSNRKGGNALKNATCCDDIYEYRNSRSMRLRVNGTVRDIVDDSQPIAQATVDLFVKDNASKEKVLVNTVLSDAAGNFTFELEPEKNYVLMVKKTDYLGTIEDMTTVNIKESRDILKTLKILKRPKEPVIIPNIRYEFDRSDLSPVARGSIDSMLIGLMTANPELIIEIQSHTDSKGTDAYNRRLSQRRAAEIVRYLVANGIDHKRLIAKGYGEDQPVAPNENPDGSDNPEGRAKNRRTQFKIIGNLDTEILERE